MDKRQGLLSGDRTAQGVTEERPEDFALEGWRLHLGEGRDGVTSMALMSFGAKVIEIVIDDGVG